MILGENEGDSNTDTRDLIFATQSLVRNLKRTESEKTDEKLSSTQLQDLISARSFVKKVKDEDSFNQQTYTNDNDDGWMLQTRLHKRKVKKDIKTLSVVFNKGVH